MRKTRRAVGVQLLDYFGWPQAKGESLSASNAGHLRRLVQPIARFGIVLIVSCVSLGLSVWFGDGAGPGVFPFLFPATVLSAWIGGLPGGVLATVIMALGAAYYHLPPAGFPIGNTYHVFALLAFTLSGILIAWLVGLLQRNRDLMKCTLLSVGDGVIATDRRQKVQVINPLAEVLTGWKREEAFGRPLGQVLRAVAATNAPNVEKLAALAMRDRRTVGLPGDALLLPKSGNPYPIDDSLAPIQSRTGNVIGTVIVFRDATQRRRAEAALIEAEAKYREIFENSIVGIFQSTPDGRYLRVNKALATMHGYNSPQEMIEVTNSGDPKGGPDATLRDALNRLVSEQDVISALPLEVSRRDGFQLSTMVTARAVRDRDGKILYYEGTQEDITDRKRLQIQLEQAQRMEAIGRLAGGVAHDFNNILNVISLYSQLAQEKENAQRPITNDIAEIKKAAAQASRLTMQLLAFSRQQIIQPAVLGLNKVVHDVSPMLERLAGGRIAISFNASHDLGLILADPVQIEQILMNLAVNARDAMPDGGQIKIETANVALDEGYARQDLPARSGPFVLLTFSDTGHGIDKDVLPKIFEPFFTTKEAGKGTGLGLATVYGIVRQNNGSIWVSSEPGRGTIFKIYFPRLDPGQTTVAA